MPRRAFAGRASSARPPCAARCAFRRQGSTAPAGARLVRQRAAPLAGPLLIGCAWRPPAISDAVSVALSCSVTALRPSVARTAERTRHGSRAEMRERSALRVKVQSHSSAEMVRHGEEGRRKTARGREVVASIATMHARGWWTPSFVGRSS